MMKETDMRRIVICGLTIVCLPLTGCGALLSWTKTAPPAMPVPLQVPVSIQEMERALLKWSEDVTRQRADAPIEEQVADAIGAARLRIGDPATPLPVPDPLSVLPGTMPESARMAETDATILALRSELKLYREREAKWKADYEKVRGTPIEVTTSVSSSLVRWGWAYIAGGIAALILVPGSVWLWLLRRARKNVQRVTEGWNADRHALATTVKGIDALKATDAAAWIALKEQLVEAHAKNSPDIPAIDQMRNA
jgi:hypothetical protein